MILYDIFSYDKTLPVHRMLPQKQISSSYFARLDKDKLAGGSQYYDGQVTLAERLCAWRILSRHKMRVRVALNYAGSHRIGATLLLTSELPK